MATGGSSVTVVGLNFAAIDISISASIENDQCQTLSWTSSSSLSCFSSCSAIGLNEDVSQKRKPITTIATLVGTGAQAFSYDSPIMSSFGFVPTGTTSVWTYANSPYSGFASVTVTGLRCATACALFDTDTDTQTYRLTGSQTHRRTCT